MQRIMWGFVLLAAISAAAAQTGERKEFEVASVKPAAPQAMNRVMVMMRGGPGSEDPGQITYTNVSLRDILKNAYGVMSYQISGPSFLDTERFDVAAKIPKGATKDDFKLMLQNLLAQRFQLKAHLEKKEVPVYALVIAKNGPKLKESAEDQPANSDAPPPLPPDGRRIDAPGGGPGGKGGPPFGPGRRGTMMMFNGGHMRLQASQQTISSMTDMLSNQLGRPVIDQTGLTGKYDYTLEFAPEDGMRMGPKGIGVPPPPPGAGPSPAERGPDDQPAANIFTALQEQLGLKLEPKKGPVDLVVIDHMEKTATEN